MFRIAVFAVVAFGLLQSAVNGEESPLSPHAGRLKVFEPLIGKSSGTWTDGTNTAKGEREVTWGEGKGYLLVSEVWRQGFNTELPKVLYGHRLISWDPAKERVTSALQTNWGMSITGKYRVEGNKLTGTDHMVLPDGTEEIRTIEIVIAEDGTTLFKSALDGESYTTKWKKP